MNDMSQTKDIEIRTALHSKKLKVYRTAPDTIVVDELGLSHAKARIDVAVINGCVHGYEIKSSLDTLNRLPAQLELYRQCLEKLTIVCAPRHTEQVEKLAPAWCGILQAEKGARGAVAFTDGPAHRLEHTSRSRPTGSPFVAARSDGSALSFRRAQEDAEQTAQRALRSARGRDDCAATDNRNPRIHADPPSLEMSSSTCNPETYE